MNWIRIALITLASGIVTSMTDWLFAGDWLHRRFTYPEVWRQGSESRAIALSSVFPFLTGFVFVCVAGKLHLNTFHGALKLAAAVWLIGPLPLILTNAAWMKLHRVFVASYSIGWLVKLLIVAIAVGWFLH
jgi:hypothetical protein